MLAGASFAACFGLLAVLEGKLPEFGLGLLCAAAALGFWSFVFWITERRVRRS